MEIPLPSHACGGCPRGHRASSCRLNQAIYPNSPSEEALSSACAVKLPCLASFCLSACRQLLPPVSCYIFVQHLLLPNPTKPGLLSATGRIEEASGKAATQKNQLSGRRKHGTCFHLAPRGQIFQGLIMWFSSKDCLFFNRTLI